MKLFGPNKKRSRTASMQLSINAIVILVMAMAVLGLGLGLIRGVLGKGKEKLSNSLDAMDLSEPATAEKPITNINNIKIKRNAEETLGIGFYNLAKDCALSTGGDKNDNRAFLNVTCKGITWDKFDYLPVTVGQGESKTIGAIVKTSNESGMYPCTVKVMCGKTHLANSASAIIKVTS